MKSGENCIGPGDNNYGRGDSYVHSKTTKLASNNIPRRAKMYEWCEAEKSINDAMQAVEKMAADIRLTQAVILLQKAQAKVADYIDGINS